MAERQDRASSDEQVLRHALEKLRTRDGLTVSRLQAGAPRVAAPLLRLGAVGRFSRVHDVDLFHAAREVIADAVRAGLNGTDRIVADAVLALRACGEVYLSYGIEPDVVDALCSGYLSRRRRYLLASWPRLHAALGVQCGEVPSDRSLRGTVEGRVLAELARQLVAREAYSLGSSSGPTPMTEATTPGAGGRVVVVGAAVMDAIFQTNMFPQLETSTEAYAFELSPGGKGLMQAVAAARLGLDVSLIAAVTDDRFGQEIIDYLEREHVDTSLLKHVPDARTPFTGVIEFELGDSTAVNWRNDRQVRLDIRDIEHFEPQLRNCQALLVTFEIPRESLHRTLDLAHGTPRQQSRPLIIVTPSQPYTDGSVSGQVLSEIDYLVGRAWELGRLIPAHQGKFDVDVTARRLLAYGVGTLCVPAGGGCTIYSESLGAFTVPTFPSQYKESSAARDAFCAALAAELIERGGEFSDEVALWATAAMAAATADYPEPNPMPSRQRVEQLLSRSRFTVSPRRADTGASAMQRTAGHLQPSHRPTTNVTAEDQGR